MPSDIGLAFVYPNTLIMFTGQKDRLTANVYNGPIEMGNMPVEWFSSAPDVVWVDRLTGELIAMKDGNAVISFRVNGQEITRGSSVEVLPDDGEGTLFIENYPGGSSTSTNANAMKDLKDFLAKEFDGVNTELDMSQATDRDLIKRIVFTSGKLTRGDINYIKGSSGTSGSAIRPNNEPLNFPNLDELYVIGTASGPSQGYDLIGWNEADSKLDRAFGTLRKIILYNTPELGDMAFQRSVMLEEVFARDTTKIGVRSFAMPQFSSASEMKRIRLPNLVEADLRCWYYTVKLEVLELGRIPPVVIRTEDQDGREGLFFSYSNPDITIVVPDRRTYNDYMKPENNTEIDWTSYKFQTLNGEVLVPVPKAPPYDDSAYDDIVKRNFSENVPYFRGNIPLALNFYTFSRWLGVGNTRWVVPPATGPWDKPQATAGSGSANTNGSISVPEVMRWAKDAGFDGVDITGYYFEGYSNLGYPTPSQKTLLLRRAKETREYADALGIRITGTGIQNSFTDPNRTRRERDVERIKFYLDFAEEMGAPAMRIFAGTPPPTGPAWAGSQS
jgi:hypothetical protein